MIRRLLALIGAVALLSACGKKAPEPPIVVEQAITVEKIIDTVVNNDEQFRDLSFATVIQGVTGTTVLPVDTTDPATAAILDATATALDQILTEFNRPESPTLAETRINEVSTHFEDSLQRKLDTTPGITCDFPVTKSGKTQRSGYPDLRIVHQNTGTVAYLDPKLVAQGSLGTTFRTFYYTPKGETNKVLDHALHLLVGIEHDGNSGNWQFLHWTLVDLSNLRIRLKTEFQTGNRELYQSENIIRTDAQSR